MDLTSFLLPYQRRFFLGKSKRKIWLAARQIGKSTCASFLAAYKALERTNGLSLVISTGMRGANEFIRKAATVAEAVKVASDGAFRYNRTADSIRFSNGSRILSLPSGSPQSLRGFTANCIIIDEAAYIENMDEVWAAIAPTVTRDPNAEVVLCSTPAGKSGFFYDVWSGKNDEWMRQCTTIQDAVRDGLKIDIPALRKTVGDPDTWDREYMCTFADSYGAMMDLGLLEFVDEIPSCATRFIGVDVGSKSDRTVIVVLAKVGDVVYVEDVVVLHKAEYETQLKVLGEVYQKYRPSSGFLDMNGIGSMLAEYATKKVSSRLRGFTTTAQNKTPCYEAMRSLVFEHKMKFSSRFRELFMADFQNVHRVVSESGKVVYEAGRYSGGHSDAVSALVLAVSAMREMPVSLGAPEPVQFSSPFGQYRRHFLGVVD
jgi:phage FluMu gp28-like protein